MLDRGALFLSWSELFHELNNPGLGGDEFGLQKIVFLFVWAPTSNNAVPP